MNSVNCNSNRNDTTSSQKWPWCFQLSARCNYKKPSANPESNRDDPQAGQIDCKATLPMQVWLQCKILNLCKSKCDAFHRIMKARAMKFANSWKWAKNAGSRMQWWRSQWFARAIATHPTTSWRNCNDPYELQATAMLCLQWTVSAKKLQNANQDEPLGQNLQPTRMVTTNFHEVNKAPTMILWVSKWPQSIFTQASMTSNEELWM